MEQISSNVFRFRDTCHVYVVKTGSQAVLVDFGSGSVLDVLPSIGVQQVTDVLVTHHHRDQCQGLARAAAAGARIWAPHMEQEYFHAAEERWQSRPLRNNYDVRQDRFSLLESVPLAGTLKDYAIYSFGGNDWTVLPTPGHTPGSISLLLDMEGRRLAFSGDLISGAGKVWSLSALQWSYHGLEGAPYSILSLRSLRQKRPDLLLPSHGDVMANPADAMGLLEERLWQMLCARQENRPLMDFLETPYQPVTPHLLRNRTSISNSYVLLSESGKALLIDYGYDFIPDFLFHPDRAVHRPWLYTLDQLKQDYGVTKIDVVVPTHYHDDHVAGYNLLRNVEGTQVWAAENFACILEHPEAYDLPCLWYDPIPVDRQVPLGLPVRWEEYTLTLYPLPGHTRYACAVCFEADGKRFMATGDQYKGENGTAWNYIYQNRFAIEDFVDSMAVYERWQPEIILPGHWAPMEVVYGYIECLKERADLLVNLHRDLLPLDQIDLGSEGFAARIQPYHWQGSSGKAIPYTIEIRNPQPGEALVRVDIAAPDGWSSSIASPSMTLAKGEVRQVPFTVTPPPGAHGRRFRLAVDLTAGDMRLGQQAEALVDLFG